MIIEKNHKIIEKIIKKVLKIKERKKMYKLKKIYCRNKIKMPQKNKRNR